MNSEMAFWAMGLKVGVWLIYKTISFGGHELPYLGSRTELKAENSKD